MSKNVQLTIKRVLDIIFSVFALLVLSPIMLISVIGIKFSSKGPLIYKAKRMGKGMRTIDVYKFRTMYVNADKAGSITANNDNRVFTFGKILRKLKIDELPQLINILQGRMSIIGPRPEAIDIVENYYTDEQKRTLDMLPGLASPGSVFNYTHGADYLSENNAEEDYAEKLMPVKLAMDLFYVDNFSILYDVKIILRTMKVIVLQLFGKKEFKYPKEYEFAALEKTNQL